MNLKGRNFLTLKDFTAEEITYFLDLAAELKEKKKAGIPAELCKGKNIALIFEKTSTRTRCSFEVAAIWTRQVLRSEKRRALQIRHECWDGFMTGLNTVVLDRRLWRSLRNMPGFPCGMV